MTKKKKKKNFVKTWMPAILHSIGVSPSWAIFGTTMYGLGTILGALLTAPLVDRLGVVTSVDLGVGVWRFVRAVGWGVRSAVRVVLSHHLWRWHRRWRMPARNQLAIGPDLSADDPLNRSGLGVGLRACRRYCWASPGRRTAGTWLASA